MRIAFINPALGGDYSTLDIGITALATYLNERTAHRATICDLTFHRRHWQRHLREHVARHRPDCVGISANTLFMKYVRQIAAEVRREYRLPVILGGYHASIHPRETVLLPDVDWVCVGDGELALPPLLDRLERRAAPDGLPGVWYQRDGAPVGGPPGGFVADLDALPIPDWDLWEDLDRYFYFLGMLYLIGNRGCPYRCTYCDAHGIATAVPGKYYRVRDPRRYAREIDHQWRKYRHRGMRLAQLFDQVFTMDPAWLREFCDEYRRLGLARELPFSTFARIDHLDEEKAALLGGARCALLRVGIESGDEHIRNDIYGKQITNDRIREIFAVCRRHGVGFTAFYMLGGPDETPATIRRTIDFAAELDANRSAFFMFKPFTEAGRRLVLEHGGYIDESLWCDVDNITFGAVVGSPRLSPRQVVRLQRAAYFRTFGRRLLRILRRQTWRYPLRLAAYLGRGLWHGLDPAYLLTYYHIYGYDNLDR